MELLKLLSVSEIAIQIVTFLVVFFLLRALAWRRILGILDARRERIAAEQAAIAKAKEDAEQLRLSYEERLAQIEKDARSRIKEAVDEGKRQSEEITRDAHRQAQRIIEQARTDIKYELAMAKEELKDKIIDLTVKATEAVIEEKLTSEQDKKLITSFVDKIDEIA